MKKLLVGLLALSSLSAVAGPWKPLQNGFDVEFKNKAVFTKDDPTIGVLGVKCSTVSTEGYVWVALGTNSFSGLAIKVDSYEQAEKIMEALKETNVCD